MRSVSCIPLTKVPKNAAEGEAAKIIQTVDKNKFCRQLTKQINYERSTYGVDEGQVCKVQRMN